MPTIEQVRGVLDGKGKRMVASKENAMLAASKLVGLGAFLPVFETTWVYEDYAFVKLFIEAAARKLPRESSYLKKKGKVKREEV